jgi:hypothetical protein
MSPFPPFLPGFPLCTLGPLFSTYSELVVNELESIFDDRIEMYVGQGFCSATSSQEVGGKRVRKRVLGSARDRLRRDPLVLGELCRSIYFTHIPSTTILKFNISHRIHSAHTHTHTQHSTKSTMSDGTSSAAHAIPASHIPRSAHVVTPANETKSSLAQPVFDRHERSGKSTYAIMGIDQMDRR